MKTVFSFELRVITCSQCGAPVTVGSAGGRLDCDHCQSPQQARAPSRALPRTAPMPEHQRIEALRRQDRGPVQAPAEIAHLFAGVDLLPWKVGEALARWKATRAAASQHHQPQVERRLRYLTLALAKHFGDESDALRERSLLESALDALELTQHRQALCGALSRSAARAGDATAAEAWLAVCDPCSTDLVSDTAYRFARATLDTYAGQFERVLQTLGAGADEVPLDDEHEPSCVALRAHALERLGRPQQALAALDGFHARSSAFQRYLCARFMSQHRALGLCERSAPLAEQRQRARGTRAAGRAAGAPVLALGLAGAMFAIGAVIGAILLVFLSPGPAHFAVGLGGSIAATLSVIGIVDTKKSLGARRLRASGVPAVARVVHARLTGVWTNGVPQLLYRVLVLPPVGTPFLAHSMFHADAGERARFGPGALVVVRADPARREYVQFELD